MFWFLAKLACIIILHDKELYPPHSFVWCMQQGCFWTHLWSAQMIRWASVSVSVCWLWLRAANVIRQCSFKTGGDREKEEEKKNWESMQDMGETSFTSHKQWPQPGIWSRLFESSHWFWTCVENIANFQAPMSVETKDLCRSDVWTWPFYCLEKMKEVAGLFFCLSSVLALLISFLGKE